MSKKTSEERRFLQRLTLHHKKPKEIGGSTSHQRNFSRVPYNKHQAWHLLHGINEAPVICKEINELWLDPDYTFICVKKEALENIMKILIANVKSTDFNT